MVREQDAFLVAGPALDFVAAQLRGRGASRLKALATAAAAAVAFIVCLAPQLIAYQALNGQFRPSPLVARKMMWSSPHGLQVLLSPEHGFFMWTPLAAVALGGLAVLALSHRAGGEWPEADRRRIAFGLLIMFVAAVYVTGSVESWTAAGAFGQRRFVNLTPLLVVGLAALFARAGGWRRKVEPKATAYALLATIGLGVWWNLALVAQFGAHMMDRQRLELGRNARTAFVTLPVSGPRLAYRYLFDRQSFYKPQPTGQ
jgi:hypothetical protein